jgi:hypothetical protein
VDELAAGPGEALAELGGTEGGTIEVDGGRNAS